ncbi:MAG: hypothetical protein AB7T06_26835 [Kofleriaceae bacterium]
MKGKGASKIVDRFLFEPECWIGSREVCAALVPLVDECYAGDARTCLAVGQYLADNPPRALMAMMFFYQACRIGDEAGCERIDDLEADARGDCAEDPWACGWRAYKKQDMDDLEESCALGATESCTWLAWNTDDLDAERAYLEQACQLANRAACADLATRLSADCDADSDDHEETHCLPIDEEGAAAAKRMACEAGWLGC